MFSASTILVRERVGWLRFADVYDLVDAGTGQQIGIGLEEPPGWVKAAKFVVNKLLLPTAVRIRQGGDATGPTVALLRKGFMVFRASVAVEDGNGRPLGRLVRAGFSFKRYFRIEDPGGAEIARVQGDWKGWNFSVLGPGDAPLGSITKKWAGLGKELFTSADNYVVDTSAGGATPDQRLLILCAALAIDVCFKENA